MGSQPLAECEASTIIDAIFEERTVLAAELALEPVSRQACLCASVLPYPTPKPLIPPTFSPQILKIYKPGLHRRLRVLFLQALCDVEIYDCLRDTWEAECHWCTLYPVSSIWICSGWDLRKLPIF